MAGWLSTTLLLAFLCANAAAQTVTSAVDEEYPPPTYTPDCDVAVVGGGPGGVYSAYRILEAGNSTNVCLFEATARVGGRVYSVRGLGDRKDLTLDMGAYRYMPYTQPIITDLIENLLELPHRLYQPAVQDYRVILTPDGSNAGFATYVERTFELAQEMGLKAQFNSKIVKLEEVGDGFVLTTFDGRMISADRVILNLPTRPLHRLLHNSELPSAEYNAQLYAPYHNRAVKLYLYYPKAWWLAAGLSNGSLSDPNPWPRGANVTFEQDAGIPIVGRYYDAHVKCPVSASASGSVAASSVAYKDWYYLDAQSLDAQNCYGFFQMIYTSDAGTTNTSHYPLDFMVDYQGALSPDTPYHVLDNSTYQGRRLLDIAHKQLMAYHTAKNITFPAAVYNSLPTQAVIALWDQAVSWMGGGWHAMKISIDDEYEAVETAIKPFPKLELYVANEAYSTQLGWSEGSLVMAENIVRDYFSAPVPSWMRPYTAEIAMFGPNFNDYETVAQAVAPPDAPAPVKAPSAAPAMG